jgi:Protein of unknown function (DUF3604)
MEVADHSYLPEHLGTMECLPTGRFVAGSYASLTLLYTAGKFGIDDSGNLRIAWRGTSDMGTPQSDDPTMENFMTVEASNGARLECSIGAVHKRPWMKSLTIRIVQGFLRKGDTITIRLGDTRRGSPGLRLQTNVEPTFEFKTLVDAFATCQFTELPYSPVIALVPGPAVRWKALLPSLNVAEEPFRLCVVAEDRWGNPTGAAADQVRLRPSLPLRGLPQRALALDDDGTLVVPDLRVQGIGELTMLVESEEGKVLCRSTPMKVVQHSQLRHYWGDLHGQSEETIGTNSVDEYFAYARDKAFLDIAGHQGNDFQITDAFWTKLNNLTRHLNVPGQFVTVPGYEWSGNTGMGGDRNVFYRHEDRPIRRSSRILVDDPSERDCYTANELFEALAHDREDAVVIAHVGGRYADLTVAHDGRLERAVEIHSAWGTFEWLLHDAFDLGYRVGVVCHSDDHKGRPGATGPGASTFGAIGGLTCYLMPRLDRDALFEALRARRHYGTTGTRMFLSVTGQFERPVPVYADDPALSPAQAVSRRKVDMGAIVQPGDQVMQLAVEAIGSAPIERLDILYGKTVVRTVRPFSPAELGSRIRVMWSGAEYRGRGREVVWRGSARITGNRIKDVTPVNFLNPAHPLRYSIEEGVVSWRSVTTGNAAGFDIWVEQSDAGSLSIETNVVSHKCDLSTFADDEILIEAGGLERRLRIYRLPDVLQQYSIRVEHLIEPKFATGDQPVYVRVTQEDGHQAWSSPIYLIDDPHASRG